MLVTGAASGMGRAIAELFADEGAQGRGDRSQRRDLPGDANWPLDVTDRGRDRARRRRGRRHARADRHPRELRGHQHLRAPIDAENYEDAWRLTLAVNLVGYVHMIQACLPHLDSRRRRTHRQHRVDRRPGATAYLSPYTVSKHGVVGLTRSLACELGPQGVTVNCICPGPINTGMTAPIPDDAKAKFAAGGSRCAATATPKRSRTWCCRVALPASSFLNGAIIPVDGGLTAMNG